MDIEEIDFVDLGDACTETKQKALAPVFQDSVFGWGARPGFVDEDAA